MARTISDTTTEICSLRHGIENAAWEEARGKLMAYLRLRGSCVGGNQEEYDALKYEIEKFIERIDEDDIYSPSHDEVTRLREENARLREALKPFADELKEQQVEVPHVTEDESLIHSYTLRLKHLRAAAAAIREGGKDGRRY